MPSPYTTRRARRRLALRLLPVAFLLVGPSACGRAASAEGATPSRAASRAHQDDRAPRASVPVAVLDTTDASVDADDIMISGTLAARAQAVVRAELSGAVLATLVERGERVAIGTPLLHLQDRAQRADHAAALADAHVAGSAAAVARRRADRLARLLAAGAISADETEDGAQAADAAEAALAAARARLARAADELSHAVVRSPIAGIVSVRSVGAGDVVQPGAALVTVLDPATMRLEAAVPAARIGAVRTGAAVTFTVSGYAGRTFAGRVERVSPAVDAATRQLPVVIAIDNRDGHLVAGLFAEGRLVAAPAAAPRSR